MYPHLPPNIPNTPVRQFFVGLQHPSTAWPFLYSMISINSLRDRKRPFRTNTWVMDSAAFTELSTYGQWRTTPQEYADHINRLKHNENLAAAVTQDLMCERAILQKTGLTIRDHQTITIERYNQLIYLTHVYIMPVLQGYSPESYCHHLLQYGSLLNPGQWVGVGSVCKLNGNPNRIEDILLAIKTDRPDLRLHGFGLKLTALKRPTVRALLHSSDSMAWSYAGRKEDGSEHDPRRALAYAARIEAVIGRPSFIQSQLFHWWS